MSVWASAWFKFQNKNIECSDDWIIEQIKMVQMPGSYATFQAVAAVCDKLAQRRWKRHGDLEWNTRVYIHCGAKLEFYNVSGSQPNGNWVSNWQFQTSDYLAISLLQPWACENIRFVIIVVAVVIVGAVSFCVALLSPPQSRSFASFLLLCSWYFTAECHSILLCLVYIICTAQTTIAC